MKGAFPISKGPGRVSVATEIRSGTVDKNECVICKEYQMTLEGMYGLLY